MARSLSKFALVLFAAGTLSGCETVKDAASSTSQTVESWFNPSPEASAKTGPNFFAGQVGGSLAAADGEAIGLEGAKALDQAPAGKAVQWRNPETGAHATLIPGDPVDEERNITAVLKKGVAPPTDLQIIGQVYASTSNANLRRAPGIENPVIGRLSRGETFVALGRSRSLAWILVAKDGEAVGYVYEALVAPAAAQGPAPALRPVQPDIAAAGTPKRIGENIVAITPCRSLAYDVVAGDGQRVQAELRACKAGDGDWEIN